MRYTRVVWITGASAGIGRALLKSVPWSDALVIGISRSGLGPEEHDPASGASAQALTADLSDPVGWDALEASFREQLRPGLKEAVLIHAAAAVGPVGFAGEVDSAAYRRAIVLNTASPPVLGEAFLQAVSNTGVSAQVLMLTSSPTMYEGWSVYKTGKAEVDAWVQHTGARLKSAGLPCRALAIAPGLVETAMQTELRATGLEDFPARQKFIEANREGRTRAPLDVARDLWRVLLNPEAANGSVLDLPDLV